MHLASQRCVLSILFACYIASAARSQTTTLGSNLALKSSTGGGVGDWTINRDGYVGTYINLAAPGTVTIGVNASGMSSGGIDPHMNIVIADTKAGFDVVSGFNNYEHAFDLPAGTYLVRTEFNNDLEQSSRALTVRDLTVTGAAVLNASNDDNALAAADSYIEHFRQGNVKIGLSGLAPGATVDVSLKRHSFNFGTAVPGSSYNGVNNYLGNGGTARQTSYQQRLNLNFNAVVPENAGKWSNNEDVRDEPPDPQPPASPNGIDNIDLILDYAQAHNMRARMHNLIWGDNGNNGQQPSWVLNNAENGLLDLAATGNATAAADLRTEISERIDYYVGDGPGGLEDHSTRYVELDVYNESYHTGENPGGLSHNYWTAYGATGIADIYRETKQAVADSGGIAKIFVNEYSVLGDSSAYFQHIETLRQAAITAGYGTVIDGIGAQYYPSSFASHVPANVMASLQNYAVQDLPIALTEFGVSAGVTAADAATILGEQVRLVFGNALSTGFFTWGFHQESGAGATTLFAPAAALYTVNTSNFNNWTLTEAGEMWQDLLGIADWDGNPDNGWTTQLNDVVVGADGTINFDGFWGDYELTINDQTYDLELLKGTTLFSLVIAPGDYNGDGQVDATDYTVWRDTLGSTGDLRADGNGNRVIDEGDYATWKSNFGMTYGAGSGQLSTTVPEPAGAWLLIIGSAIVSGRGLGIRTNRSRRAS
jgi:GH35 family endo-1,4-beta-xylanase